MAKLLIGQGGVSQEDFTSLRRLHLAKACLFRGTILAFARGASLYRLLCEVVGGALC